MTPELKLAIEDLYNQFNGPAPQHIDGCPCCVDADDVRILTTLPLKALTPDHLSPYVGSVFLTAGDVVDYKYFLPRIFELSLDDPPWVASTETVMGKLRRADWQTWPENERIAMQSFIDAWFAMVLQDAEPPPDGIWYAHPVDTIVCGLAHTGLDLEPYLTRLLDCPPALRALYLCNTTAIDADEHPANPFWEGLDTEARTVRNFLQSTAVSRALSRT